MAKRTLNQPPFRVDLAEQNMQRGRYNWVAKPRCISPDEASEGRRDDVSGRIRQKNHETQLTEAFLTNIPSGLR
jgi:hypothetical protein